MFRTNFSSQISRDQISTKYYKPQNAVERSVLTCFEKVPVDIYATQEEGVSQIADAIAARIKERQREGRFCVIGAGTGETLRPLYAELVRKHKEDNLSFRNVIVFNLYEYYPLEPDVPHSAFHLLKELLLDKVDISKNNIYTINGSIPQEKVAAYCASYEQQLDSYGGMDLAIFGVGREGNIGMNMPGSSLSSTTRLILMDPISRQECAMNLGAENIPPCAITMGISTILSARKAYMLAWGDEKAEIIAKAVEERESESLPASFLQSHNNASLCIDLPASTQLTRIRRPWLVTSCDWTPKLIRSAIVWLCQELKKPVLKLTNKDYNEHGLSELLAIYGSAYNVNLRIFNDLQHTITGWPGGKPNADDSSRPERAVPYPKRVLVFSPHPGDDVISMGGTIRRLVEQNHEVHVAYQTSGNIAVGDDEVMRYLHFENGFNQLFLANHLDDSVSSLYENAKVFFSQKKSGDIDTPEILSLKGLIRKGEAHSACSYNQIPMDHVHFLDMPFYETGSVEKKPLSEVDIRLVREQLQQIQPHQIFLAGDQSDPHGTFRVCADAVLTAIHQEKEAGAEWLDNCRVWMYRGVWTEWSVEDIEMAVPISPEELRAKRNAILKHQSQMDAAPYMGNDERLFWQRSEDRSRATAQVYDALGLACYEAMEAFVQYKL